MFSSKIVNEECGSILHTPMIVIGVLILIFSLAGLIGSVCDCPALLFIYQFFVLVMILAAVGFTIFALAVTNKGAGKFLSGKGYKEYRLGDYSHWLQKKVNNAEDWNKIKSCLIASPICTDFQRQYSNHTLENFNKQPLNSIQSGCCKPPNDCGFIYRSPTNWTAEEMVVNNKNPDCKVWDNSQQVLCFNCESCKAGILQRMKNSWKEVILFNGILIGCLIIVYAIGCRAFINIMKQDPRTHP
ncbi:Tetraspanin/Peripherin [Corchorus olitorius]|uniref:Tetraspanin/Peripherin n=1 Tax=Corchorus olitorius TaxID=93759 RepID=A0A1R3K132_9ROSI|nr:Tetraspanin/Peripherin [Corchorus olitorius]